MTKNVKENDQNMKETENEETHSQSIDNSLSGSSAGNSIRLPGIEIGFPTTWAGTVFGFGLVFALIFVFMSFSADLREKWFANYFNLEAPQDNQTAKIVYDSIPGLSPAYLDVEKSKNAKLSSQLAESKEKIKALSTELVEFKNLVKANENSTVDAAKIKIAEELVENTEIFLTTSANSLENKLTPKETADEIIANLAKENKYRALVGYFSKKKSRWIKNYLWVNISKVEDEILEEYPDLFRGRDELVDALEQLVDLKVLGRVEMKGGGIGYGVQQNSPTYATFLKLLDSTTS